MPKATHKPILLSVKPQYADCIVEGVKTIELRRYFPDCLPGTKVYLCSSPPKRNVIGVAEVVRVDRLPLGELWNLVSIEAMISWEEFFHYFSEMSEGYAITLQKPLAY